MRALLQTDSQDDEKTEVSLHLPIFPSTADRPSSLAMRALVSSGFLGTRTAYRPYPYTGYCKYCFDIRLFTVSGVPDEYLHTFIKSSEVDGIEGKLAKLRPKNSL